MRMFTPALLVCLLTAPALGQFTILHDIDGTSINSLFGHEVAGGRDYTGDGIPDLLIGARSDDTAGPNAGMVRGYSGATGALLFTLFGTDGNDQYGEAVDLMPDLDGDGCAELLIGVDGHNTPFTSGGRVLVLSGDDPNTIIYSREGTAGQQNLGQAAACVGDVNGDGVADFAAGAPQADIMAMNGGYVTVWSGLDGSVLYTWHGTMADDRLGASVAAAGDVNDDGFADVIAGMPQRDVNGVDAGGARIFSGMDGSIIDTLEGDTAGDEFGRSVAGLGDINGDGFDDVAVGAPKVHTIATNEGQVTVYSGFDRSVLFQIDGTKGNAEFGYSFASAGDVNGDGTGDFVVGEWRFDASAGSPTNHGRAWVFSGLDATEIFHIVGDSGGDALGEAVAGGGDIDGDGLDDVVIGVPRSEPAGVNSGNIKVLAATDDTLPGTNEDLILLTGVNAPPTRVPDIKNASAGSQLFVKLDSPLGTFDPYPPIITGQLITTGDPIPSAPGFPVLHADPGLVPAPFILLNGLATPLGAMVLPPDGVTLGFAVPASLAGMTGVLQGISITSTAANSILAATAAHQVVFLP